MSDLRVGRGFDQLEVGDRRVVTRTFTEEDVVKFAEVSGDYNSFHLDDEFARRSPFGAKIVHGLLTGSLLTRFGGTDFPGPGTIATEMSFKFIAPVYVGETVTAEAEVLSKDPGRGRVRIGMKCHNQRGALVLAAEMTVIPPA